MNFPHTIDILILIDIPNLVAPTKKTRGKGKREKPTMKKKVPQKNKNILEDTVPKRGRGRPKKTT